MSQYTPRTRRYWALCAQVKREEPNCALCGGQIDSWRSTPDPWAFQCDHVISPKLRPDLAEVRANLRASHARCNRDRERKTPRAAVTYVSVEEF